MTVTGIDIAWARPSVAQIKASGAHWVARYFSTDSSKNLRPAEVTAYHDAGLSTVVVWETTTGRARAGHAAGVADALAAEAQRKAVGLPGDMPVHFAVDEDTSWATVAPYFAGVASVIGQQRTGVYGGYPVIEGAAAAGYRYLWQTTAWSAGHWSTHATIRQSGGTTLSGGADWDTATAPDFGQYPRPTSPTPEDPMPTAQEIAKAVMDYPLASPTAPKGTDANRPASAFIRYADARHAQVMAQLGALQGVVTSMATALQKGGSLTAAQATAAAEAGAKAALAELGHALTD